MTNAAQKKYWNETPGQKWREYQASLDTLFQGVSDRLLDIAQPSPGGSVLDVGCGTGALALDLSEQVGDSGSVLALDVSEPLLDLAAQRASSDGRSNIEFQLADAQSFEFDKRVYDLVVSRFGVMFFEDPVAAFDNIRSSLKPDGRIVFAAWASASENPWFYISREAAIDQLGKPSPQPADAPGPTAFADVNHVTALLGKAGLTHVDVSVDTIPLVVKGDANDAATLACYLGPAARIANEKGATREDLEVVADTVSSALRDYVDGSQVRRAGKDQQFLLWPLRTTTSGTDG